MFSQAQEATTPWALSLGSGLLKYQGNPENPNFVASNFHPGFQIGTSKYLASAFDFRASFLFAPKVAFPSAEGEGSPTPLYDLNYQLVFKVNNGVFLRENFPVAPYIYAGLGGSYVVQHPDIYVPIGLGINARLNRRWSIRLESIRKLSVNKDYQHLAHAIAFVYNIGKAKTTPEQEPPVIADPAELVAELVQDQDQDGISDEQDACPDLPGSALNLGCPDADTASTQGSQPIPTLSSQVQELSHLMNLFDDESAMPEPEQTVPGGDISQAPLAAILTPESEPDYSAELPACDREAGTWNGIAPIYFDYGSDQLPQTGMHSLEQLVNLLKGCPRTRLVLKGHADAIGSDRDNLILSIMRAYHVKYYLVTLHGISQSRITSVGFGERKPVTSNTSQKGRELNRRVDFQVIFVDSL